MAAKSHRWLICHKRQGIPSRDWTVFLVNSENEATLWVIWDAVRWKFNPPRVKERNSLHKNHYWWKFFAYIERISDTLHVINCVHIVKHENMLYGLIVLSSFRPFLFAAVHRRESFNRKKNAKKFSLTRNLGLLINENVALIK